MLNTRWALLIPQRDRGLAGDHRADVLPNAIPDELYRGGELDGASDLRFLWSVVTPAGQADDRGGRADVRDLRSGTSTSTR